MRTNLPLFALKHIAGIVFIIVLFSFKSNAASEDYLVGHWTFEPGSELIDLKGNFGNLVLHGAASISGGMLNVDDGSTYAVAPSYTGPTITEQTLISWIILEDLNVRSGSALTVDAITVDEFDAIVYSETVSSGWTAGSSFLQRTETPVPGFIETTTGNIIKMAISYADDGFGGAHVKIYRNDVLIGDYTKGSLEGWIAGNTEAIFGIRHSFPNGTTVGELDAKILEAKIYNGALTVDEIENIIPGGYQEVPVNNWAVYLGIFLIAIFTIFGIKKFRISY